MPSPVALRVWRLAVQFATGGIVVCRATSTGPDAVIQHQVWLGHPDDVALIRLGVADLARHRGGRVTVRVIAAAMTEIGGMSGVSADVLTAVRGREG
jgi:hypothetical protein